MQNTRFKTHPTGNHKACFYAQGGRIRIPRICIRNFQCRHCSFYYWLEEVGETSFREMDPEADFPRLKAA